MRKENLKRWGSLMLAATILGVGQAGIPNSRAARVAASTPYPIVDTGQEACYDDQGEISDPAAGESFYGQDAQHQGNPPSYTLSQDGLTVYDNETRLTWQRSPDTSGEGSITASDKLSWTEAQARPAALNAAGYGGFDDWRLPTIKELYSLIDFRGTDPSGLEGDDTSGLTPYIDTAHFEFAYGDVGAGERIIDSQYASSTLYVSTALEQSLFGVNFADGRIKGYGLSLFGQDKTFFVQCVRGNTDYGTNAFTDNGDGTVTDEATGLMWMQEDAGTGLSWQEALAWVETANAAHYRGHDDWRLPNAKELQSIVDYTRSPDTHGTAAIDPVFSCTQITNEAGQADYPFYWSGTTHSAYNGMGAAAAYVAFGRGLGYMFGSWVDVHGAGCQRSDPKSGDPAEFPFGRGPQGDAIRIENYVRCVRDVAGVTGLNEAPAKPGELRLSAEPNPAYRATEFAFSIPTAGPVVLEIFDVVGRQVSTLVDANLAVGDHRVRWSGVGLGGQTVPAGIYMTRLLTPDGVAKTKVMLTH